MSTIRSGDPPPLALRHLGAVTLTRAILSDAAIAAAEQDQRKSAAKNRNEDDSRKISALPRLDSYA